MVNTVSDKKHNCPNCGAPIHNPGGWEYVCPYCGIQLEWQPVTHVSITVDRKEIVPLAAEIEVDREALEYITRAGHDIPYIKQELIKDLSYNLAQFMMIYKDYCIEKDKIRYRGVIKVQEVGGYGRNNKEVNQMKIINASYEILRPNPVDGIAELKHLELCARTAYKSEDKITEDGESAKRMIKRLIESGHESTLEHGGMTVKFIVDRGVSHEIVRHRLASYTQESTRYCNYSKDKFGNEITVIEPCFMDNLHYKCSDDEEWKWGIESYDWYDACLDAEKRYFAMLSHGYTPQEARAVLPNSLKTEVVMTANWREWRHFLKLRSAPDAHPQIREVAIPLLNELHEKIPVLFDDIVVN